MDGDKLGGEILPKDFKRFCSSWVPGRNFCIQSGGFRNTLDGDLADGECVCPMVGRLRLSLAMARFPLGAGGNTEPTGMVFTVLAASGHVKANFAPVFWAKVHSGKSFYRTGINADVTFSTRLIEGDAGFQGSIGQHRYKAGSGT